MTTLQDPADRTAAQARWPGRPRHPVLRVLAMAGVFLCALTAFLLGAIYIICKGPSPAARDLFVHTVMETSAAKFTARIFLSEEEVQAILDKNGVLETADEDELKVLNEAPYRELLSGRYEHSYGNPAYAVQNCTIRSFLLS